MLSSLGISPPWGFLPPFKAKWEEQQLQQVFLHSGSLSVSIIASSENDQSPIFRPIPTVNWDEIMKKGTEAVVIHDHQQVLLATLSAK